jgi:hypothetical protein
MALLTLPPRLVAAAYHDFLRRQRAVEGGVPLFSHGWLQRGQVIESCQDLVARAVRTAGPACCPGAHRRLVRVPQRATPPDPAIAGRCAGLGGQRGVFAGIPLLRHLRVTAAQVVLTGNDHFPGTDWTARAAGPGRDQGLPSVPSLAAPPDFFPGTGTQLLGPQGPVACKVPLPDQVWMRSRQVVLPGGETAAGTIGATRAAYPGLDRCLPSVSFLTAPPNFLVTAVGKALGRLEVIVFYVPLLQQLWSFLLHTVVVEG